MGIPMIKAGIKCSPCSNTCMISIFYLLGGDILRFFKRIVASLSSFVITFMVFAVPAAPIAKAGVIEDAAYVYTQYSLVQQMLHYVFVAIGAGSGAVIGSIALPGVGTVAGTTVGTFIGDFLEAGVKDIASYYAAGYTDEDFAEAYWDTYYAGGEYGGGTGRPSISSDDLVFSVDYYSSLREKGLCFYANYENKNGADGACFDYGASSVANRVSAGGSGFLSLAVTPGEKVSISVESEYDLDVAFWFLTSTGYEAVLNSQDLLNSAGSPVAYRKDTGWISPGDIVTVPDGVVCAWLNCRKSDNTEMSLSDLSSFRVNFWDRESSLANSGDRLGSYMEDLDAYNQSNPYLENQYTPNYYITPDDGDTLYSPAVFSESTKTFTEPHTGNQYLCTRWAYHYSEDNTLTIVGMPVLEGDYLGSYIMDMADNSYYVDGIEIPVLWIIYCTEAMLIMPLYRDADGVITPIGYQWYDYAVVAQTECGIGEHDMDWETTVEPTCTGPGTETGTCSICGETQTYQLNQLDHIYKSSVTQQATCTGTGIMIYTCTACGNEYTETIAATGVHSYNYSLTTTPTCTTEGTALYTCSVCGNQYAETVPAISHKEQIIASVETVYDEDGYVVTAGYTVYECTTCGQQRREVDDVAGTGDDLLGGLGGAITSFAKRAWLAISSGLGKLFSGFADLLGGIFGFFTDTVIGGVKNFFATLSDDSILGYYQDDTGAAALPEGVGSAMAMIPAFFGGLPAELQAPVIFGIAALFLIAALKLFL